MSKEHKKRILELYRFHDSLSPEFSTEKIRSKVKQAGFLNRLGEFGIIINKIYQ